MEAMVASLQKRCDALKAAGTQPCLTVLQVGNDPAAANYQASIRRRADMVGVELRTVVLEETASLDAVCGEIHRLNEDDTVHGVLLYLPLPGALHGHEAEVCSCLKPEKDVDGVTEGSAAAVYQDRNTGFAPCTAEACLRLLEYYEVPMEGKTACVVGRSGVIGKPAAMLLLRRNATVTVAHSRTKDLSAVTSQADILIAAAGRAGLITGKHVKPGAVVVDVGANWDGEKIVGDVRFEEAETVAEAVSPVPGGVGLLTSCVLMEHVILAAERK